MAVDSSCENLPEQLAILNRVEKEWTANGVSFATVNAGGTESFAMIKEIKKKPRDPAAVYG